MRAQQMQIRIPGKGQSIVMFATKGVTVLRESAIFQDALRIKDIRLLSPYLQTRQASVMTPGAEADTTTKMLRAITLLHGIS